MKIAGTFILLIASLVSFSQDREFPDYRSKKENFSRIQEKDIRSDVACFAIGGMDESIGKGKLVSVPATKYGSDFITFSGNNLQVTITAGTFDESAHKYTYYNKVHLVKIDAKPFYGSYDEKPETTIQSVVVLLNKDTIPIPQAAYADLYNPEFTYTDKSGVVKSYNNVYLSADKKTVYIYMLKRSPKSNYEVTWVIQDKKYLRRVVDFGFFK
ncbi:MAG TPA: hypothetical protein VEV87_07050 [Chitinophagaceae bacterium]|nr:hypothetical protein [Chitinophagaceae bacterium]